MERIRLNKLMAELGFSSRRGADVLIEEGRVKLNGKKAQLGDKVDPEKDRLVFNGRTIDLQAAQETLSGENFEYWILNKPARVISSVDDPDGRKTVMRFLRGKTDARLYPVGRLDYESEGLLLMTNDGDLAYRLTHPKYEVEKEYLVLANGIFSQDKIARLKHGVRLADSKARVDELELIEKNGRDLDLKFIMHEGRKREVRRICARVGWEVMRLTRVRLANLELGNLKPGTARKLTEEEIQDLKKSVKLI